MPRFFMNLRYRTGLDGVAVDQEGDDLTDEAKLHERALQVARLMIARDQLFTPRNWLTCSFEVTDEAGQLIMTVPFSEVVSDNDGEC